MKRRTQLTLGPLDATDLLTAVNKRIAELEHSRPRGKAFDPILERQYRMRRRLTAAIYRLDGLRQGRSGASA